MAVGVFMEFPGVTREQYEQLSKAWVLEPVWQLVGLLSMVGGNGAHMLIMGVGVAFQELVAANLREWMELLAFDFFGPTLFFVVGGLFADTLKTRAYHKA